MVQKIFKFCFVIILALAFQSFVAALPNHALAQTVNCSYYYSLPNCYGNESICGSGEYCTRISACAVFRCQPPKADGETCLDMPECQPMVNSSVYPYGNRACAVKQCQTGGALQSACCPSGKFWCPSTNSCTGQGDGSCPCATESNPTNTPTPVPQQGDGGNTGTTCSSNGVKSLTYNQSGCPNYTFAKSVTVVCNDESTKTISAQFGCTNTLGLKLSAQSYCSSHKACPTATPTITPTPTNTPIPARTNTPTPTTKPPLSCDANKDGVTNDADLPIIKSEWFGGATTKNADCNKDGVVNGLDFQMWRDVWILKKS